DLAAALVATGETVEAEALLDALPANLATDDRALGARAALGFAASLREAPDAAALEAAVAADPGDLRARHLLGARCMVAGRHEEALEHFMEMLRRDRGYEDGLPRRLLIEAFRVIRDDDLVGRFRQIGRASCRERVLRAGGRGGRKKQGRRERDREMTV